MRYGLVLLDFDGTLVDSLPAMVDATARTFLDAGLPEPDPLAVRAAMADGRGLEYALTRLHPTLHPDQVPHWVATWRNTYDNHSVALVKPFDGALGALAAMRRAGARLAVVSNRDEPALRRAAEHMGIAPLVDALVGDVDGQPKKPTLEMFTTRLQPLLPGRNHSSGMVVGDSLADLEFAHVIGFDACWAAYGLGDPEACLAAQPEHRIDHVTQLAALVE